jgi:hypothetical protein
MIVVVVVVVVVVVAVVAAAAAPKSFRKTRPLSDRSYVFSGRNGR